MAQLIVVDAAVLIAALDETHAHHPLAAQTILTDDELAIRTLTLAEVFVGAIREDEVAEVRRLLRDADYSGASETGGRGGCTGQGAGIIWSEDAGQLRPVRRRSAECSAGDIRPNAAPAS